MLWITIDLARSRGRQDDSEKPPHKRAVAVIPALWAASISNGESPTTVTLPGRRPSRASAAWKISGCGFERSGRRK
jgi:hypothetical protein